MCVALSHVAILVRCPKIVKNSWGSSKPKAIGPQKVPNRLFLTHNSGSALSSDNRIYFCLYDCPGDLGNGMRFLIVWDCLSTSATLPNVNITPLNFATSKHAATNPSAGRDLRRKKACERGRREESEEKDKQWAIPRETLHSSLSCFLF